MAAKILLQRRAITPVAASALAASILLYPQRTLHAEAPLSPPPHHPSSTRRKPIYSDLAPPSPPPRSQAATHALADPPQIQEPTILRPTPTDRLAASIRHARLTLYIYTLTAEDAINTLFSRLLSHERTLTSTLASLRPPPSSHEHLLPGSLYVLVAAMAGSIMTRNRNILLRATVPGAVGVGTAWIVLPVTMRNVSALVWEWEKDVPVLASNHMRVKGAVEEGMRWGAETTRGLQEWGEEVMGRTREGIEGWVKGR